MSLFASASRLVLELLYTHGLTAIIIISVMKLLLVLTEGLKYCSVDSLNSESDENKENGVLSHI
jgi:hypothetical protein